MHIDFYYVECQGEVCDSWQDWWTRWAYWMLNRWSVHPDPCARVNSIESVQYEPSSVDIDDRILKCYRLGPFLRVISCCCQHRHSRDDKMTTIVYRWGTNEFAVRVYHRQRGNWVPVLGPHATNDICSNEWHCAIHQGFQAPRLQLQNVYFNIKQYGPLVVNSDLETHLIIQN